MTTTLSPALIEAFRMHPRSGQFLDQVDPAELDPYVREDLAVAAWSEWLAAQTDDEPVHVEPDEPGDPATAWDHELTAWIRHEYTKEARGLDSYLVGCVAATRRNLRGTRESPPEVQRHIAEFALQSAQIQFDVGQVSYALREIEGIPSSFLDDPEGVVSIAREDLAEERDCRLDEVTTEDVVECVVARARRASRFEAKLAEAQLADEVKRARQIEQAKTVERPVGVSFADMLDEPDTPTPYRVDGLLPLGGRVILAAQGKAGKTTTVGNLIRCLVNGEPFLGRHPTTPVLGRVTLIDNEMPQAMLRKWLGHQGIERPDRVWSFLMRGAAGSFDILNPEGLKVWAAKLKALETEVLIVDCLKPLLQAFGLNENTEVGKFLDPLGELAAMAGISELILVHHMGHNGERSRGDSRLRDWPDVEWRLVREDPDDPASRRYFAAYGRDVEVPESALNFDRASRHLTIAGTGSRKTAKADAEVGRVVELLRSQPGLSGRALVRELKKCGVSEKVTQEAVKRAVDSGQVTALPEGAAHKHYAAECGKECGK